jgi:hypothetical protein
MTTPLGPGRSARRVPIVVRFAACLVAFLLLAPVGSSGASTVDPAQLLSAVPILENPLWKLYPQDPPALVYPRSVAVEGPAAAVSTPNGLRAAGGAVTAMTATAAGQPSLVVDLGSIVGGRVEIGLTATDGTAVRVGYSEQRQYLTPYGDAWALPGFTDDPETGRSDLITTTGAPLAWVSPGVRGGQRWLRIQLAGAGSVSIDYVRVRVNQYRPSISDYSGRFLSSDNQINRIWWANAYALNLTTIRDDRPGQSGPWVRVDGAKRDRTAFPGDTITSAVSAYYTTRSQPQFVRSTLSLFSCQQYPDGYIPFGSDVNVVCPDDEPGAPDGPPAGGNPLFQAVRLGGDTASWIITLGGYLQQTDDVAFTAKMLPVARRGLDFLAAHAPGGLYRINLNQPQFEIVWHPDDVIFGTPDTYTNVIWYRALRAQAGIERRLGNTAEATGYEQRAEVLRQTIIAVMWDPVAGAFVNNPANPTRDHAQDANVAAVRAGVVTGADAARALDYVRTHLDSPLGRVTAEVPNDPMMQQYISPFISSEELFARFGQADGAGAMDLIRRTWGHFLDTDPGGPPWERLALDGNPYRTGLPPGAPPPGPGQVPEGNTSLAHGWGTGPVAALSGYVLGLQPASPGWATWTVAPQPTDLSWAQGQVGTPHGDLVSRWLRDADRTFWLTVRAPAGTSGTVAVPELGRSRTIAMDGKVVWTNDRPAGGVAATRQNGAVAFTDVTGSHTFAWIDR